MTIITAQYIEQWLHYLTCMGVYGILSLIHGDLLTYSAYWTGM